MSEAQNVLSDARGRLVQLLTDADLHGFAVLPATVTPPFVYVDAGDPYITFEGGAFGAKIAHFHVVPVARPGTNDVVSDELDALLLAVIEAVDDHDGFFVVDVDVPGHILINGQKHPAVSINVQIEIPRS